MRGMCDPDVIVTTTTPCVLAAGVCWLMRNLARFYSHNLGLEPKGRFCF